MFTEPIPEKCMYALTARICREYVGNTGDISVLLSIDHPSQNLNNLHKLSVAVCMSQVCEGPVQKS